MSVSVTKRELIEYCLTFPSVYEDYPFDETTAVIRHCGNKKMFALIDEKDSIPYINLKCEPMRADFLRNAYQSVKPGWHMNKTHWITVTMHGDVLDTELFDMIISSFDLTKPKKKKGSLKDKNPS